jgi:hypothetical protein
MCVGREYALNHLVVFAAVAATRLAWTRKRDGLEDTIVYLPTLYPGSCLVDFRDATPADFDESRALLASVVRDEEQATVATVGIIVA